MKCFNYNKKNNTACAKTKNADIGLIVTNQTIVACLTLKR